MEMEYVIRILSCEITCSHGSRGVRPGIVPVRSDLGARNDGGGQGGDNAAGAMVERVGSS